jgi:DNA-binding Xre family transcriptional regulator
MRACERRNEMPTRIDIEPVRRRWEAKYNRTLSDDELVEIAKISTAVLHRMTSGTMIAPDLRKILQLCKALECDPSEIIARQ